jgi:hypothetical protein
MQRRRYFSSGPYPQLHTIAEREPESLMGREKKCSGIFLTCIRVATATKPDK